MSIAGVHELARGSVIRTGRTTTFMRGPVPRGRLRCRRRRPPAWDRAVARCADACAAQRRPDLRDRRMLL